MGRKNQNNRNEQNNSVPPSIFFSSKISRGISGVLIEELRTTILWGNVCFIFCICRNFIFKTNDIACIIRNAPLQLLPDQGRRIFRRMSLIQLFIVFVLDIQRKITAVQDSVPGSLLHQ